MKTWDWLNLTFARPTRARPPRGPRSRRPAPLRTAATLRWRGGPLGAQRAAAPPVPRAAGGWTAVNWKPRCVCYKMQDAPGMSEYCGESELRLKQARLVQKKDIEKLVRNVQWSCLKQREKERRSLNDAAGPRTAELEKNFCYLKPNSRRQLPASPRTGHWLIQMGNFFSRTWQT